MLNYINSVIDLAIPIPSIPKLKVNASKYTDIKCSGKTVNYEIMIRLVFPSPIKKYAFALN
jgi:hypothetical protein